MQRFPPLAFLPTPLLWAVMGPSHHPKFFAPRSPKSQCFRTPQRLGVGQRGSCCRVSKTSPIPGSDLCHNPGHAADESSTAKQTLESEELLLCLLMVLSHSSKCPLVCLHCFWLFGFILVLVVAAIFPSHACEAVMLHDCLATFKNSACLYVCGLDMWA